MYRADPKKSPRFNSQNIVKELLKYVKENLRLKLSDAIYKIQSIYCIVAGVRICVIYL